MTSDLSKYSALSDGSCAVGATDQIPANLSLQLPKPTNLDPTGAGGSVEVVEFLYEHLQNYTLFRF